MKLPKRKAILTLIVDYCLLICCEIDSAKELKNLVREFCEDRDAGRLVHPNNASIFFDRTNGKTRLTISSITNNKLFVQVIINGLTRYFYINVKFNKTPLAYNWWKVYSRRITKKLGKIINILEKGEYNE